MALMLAAICKRYSADRTRNCPLTGTIGGDAADRHAPVAARSQQILPLESD